MKTVPVYAFTGFLESGKTKFIQETLEDPRFNSWERTLLIVCEEGEEEYDFSTYPHKNVWKEVVEEYDDLTPEKLQSWQKQYKAQRVVVELNGMQPAGAFYEKMPENWEIAQEVFFADARSILNFNANMRSLVVDKLQGCELVVFNRMEKGQDVMPYHKLARALNRRVDIIYDYTDGTTQFDEIEDPLPFDITADTIEINDDDYAIWYRDIAEESQKYDGKNVRFKAQVANLRRGVQGWFAPGRFVMTCCVEDIEFMAIPCKYDRCEELTMRSWVWVTAHVESKAHNLYHGEVGPVLTALSVEPADAAEPDVCTF